MMPSATTGATVGLCSLALALLSCVNEPAPPAPGRGAARFETLLVNPKWYRTLDSNHTIIVSEGTLAFAWTFADSARRPDSFYVGIDTLWMLPQNVNGDTSLSGDWDLQICLDGPICLGGLVNGVTGGDSPYPFGGESDTFATEHHIQFFPALSSSLPVHGISPDSAIFGGLMYARSRSGGSPSDTVLVYGSWRLPWDDAFAPPARPVNGYLPRRSDFAVVDGKIRYTGP